MCGLVFIRHISIFFICRLQIWMKFTSFSLLQCCIKSWLHRIHDFWGWFFRFLGSNIYLKYVMVYKAMDLALVYRNAGLVFFLKPMSSYCMWWAQVITVILANWPIVLEVTMGWLSCELLTLSHKYFVFCYLLQGDALSNGNCPCKLCWIGHLAVSWSQTFSYHKCTVLSLFPLI